MPEQKSRDRRPSATALAVIIIMALSSATLLAAKTEVKKPAAAKPAAARTATKPAAAPAPARSSSAAKAPASAAQPVIAAATVLADPASLSAEERQLLAQLSALCQDKRLDKSRPAICVVDVASRRELFGLNQSAPLIPASNMKLLTTAAAIATLGPDWNFRTIIGTLPSPGPAAAPLVPGAAATGRTPDPDPAAPRRLDLVILGGGDPNLSGRFYHDDVLGAVKRWAEILRQRGLSRIEGDLVFDDSIFEETHINPNWAPEDLDHWFAAPVAGFFLNDACVNVHLSAPRVGGPVEVRLDPPSAYFSVVNRVQAKAARSRSAVSAIISAPAQLTLCGSTPAGSSDLICRPVDDPGLFAAMAVKETFRTQGVEIAGRVVRRRVWTDQWQLPPGFKAHIVHTSSLMQTVDVANTRSQNLYAECLLKALAAYGTSPDRRWPNAVGSWARGAAVTLAALRSMGVETAGCVVDDGSGLSRGDRVSARQLTQLLTAMAHSPAGQAWLDSLAKWGDDDGSLRSRRDDPLLTGRVFAKTGTLEDTKALSGYVQTQSGRLLAFSALFNDARVHWQLNDWTADLCRTLAKY